jgi:hypothetical protein
MLMYTYTHTCCQSCDLSHYALSYPAAFGPCPLTICRTLYCICVQCLAVGFEEVSASDVRELQAECDAAVVLLDVRSTLEFDTRCGKQYSAACEVWDGNRSLLPTSVGIIHGLGLIFGRLDQISNSPTLNTIPITLLHWRTCSVRSNMLNSTGFHFSL